MVLKVVQGLPNSEALRDEGVQIIESSKVGTTDQVDLKIGILNLMATKEVTELQLLRLLGHFPATIGIDLIHAATHKSTHVTPAHLENYYTTFDAIKDKTYDGFIITGAPVEELAYEEVDYLDELNAILDWSKNHVTSRLFVCWGAQYVLSRDYDVTRHFLESKVFGIFPYDVQVPNHPLLRGFDAYYNVPQSRLTQMDSKDIVDVKDLTVLASHPVHGPDLLVNDIQKDVFVLGHLEYDAETLALEYQRDVDKGIPITIPEKYFPNDDATVTPLVTWRSHGFILANNWLKALWNK